MSQAHSTAVNSFNANHVSYDQFRPSFDDSIVDAFLSDLELFDKAAGKYKTDKKVLELAVGTGKFTKSLVSRGWGENLLGVEPSVGMLETFHSQLPLIKAVEGSSYKLPVEDSTVDAIIVAQGFHWFADLESLKEINRVLKKGGHFGCIWNFDCPSKDAQGLLSLDDKINYIFQDGNERDKFESLVKVIPNTLTKPYDLSMDYFKQSPWAVDVGTYVYSFDVNVPQYRRGDWRKLLNSKEANQYFTRILNENFYFSISEIDWDGVYKLWETRSYITKLSDAEKLEIKSHIEKLLSDTTTEKDKVLKNGKVFLKKALGTHTIVTKVQK